MQLCEIWRLQTFTPSCRLYATGPECSARSYGRFHGVQRWTLQQSNGFLAYSRIGRYVSKTNESEGENMGAVPVAYPPAEYGASAFARRKSLFDN